MKMLPIMEMAKKKKTFYCNEKGLFCKVIKCTQKVQECATEKEVILASQIGELASCT